jgi:D-glycero-beta-D-manno-heptose 1-phosphate adenylyltransferase
MLYRKVITRAEAVEIAKVWRESGETIVFTNGCFDILHKGHVDYLYRASLLGKRLIIGLNSDASVSRIKGPSRPIQDESSRSILLAGFFFVDAVVIFDEETPYELIRAVQPDILVKGKDYQIEEIIGGDLVLERGGRVETLDFIEGYSTSAIIQKILEGN